MIPQQPIKNNQAPSSRKPYSVQYNEDADDTVIQQKPIEKENQKPAGNFLVGLL